MAALLAPMTDRGPHAEALADERSSLSWAELDRRVNQWIAVLRGQGLRTGDRVAIVAGNRPATFEALLACLHCGLVVVPVSWRLTVPEITYLLDDCGAAAVLAEPSTAARVASAAGQAVIRPAFAAVFGAEPLSGLAAADKLLAGAGQAEPEEQCSGSVMLYTSATTGHAKGVITGLFVVGASLDRVRRTVAGLGTAFGIPEQGRSLLVGPWYHAAQVFFSLFPLLRGCSLVLRNRFDAAVTVRDLDRQQITHCHLVPTQFVRMLGLDSAVRAEFSGTTIERIWHGGAACPVHVKRAMIDWWGPVIVEYYAATEAGIISMIDSAEWLARPGSVGRPQPPTEVEILAEDGTPCPAGVSGAIYVRRPPGLGFEYYNAPDKTAAAHRAPGTFTLGDLGQLDEDGYLYLTGRTLDTIISGGVNIYPAEVEAVLLSHPAVRDAAVLGIPDDDFGERVLAVIETEQAAGLAPEDVPEALDAHCAGRLAGFKRPRSYRVVATLPRQPTGKLDRQALRAPYWGG